MRQTLNNMKVIVRNSGSAFLLFVCIIASQEPVCTQIKGETPVCIGFMGETLDADEEKAVHEFLSRQKGYKFLAIAALQVQDVSTEDFTHVWIHQLSENLDEYKLVSVGNAIKKFYRYKLRNPSIYLFII